MNNHLYIDLYYTNDSISLKIEVTNKQVEVIYNEIPHDICMGSFIAQNGQLRIE